MPASWPAATVQNKSRALRAHRRAVDAQCAWADGRRVSLEADPQVAISASLELVDASHANLAHLKLILVSAVLRVPNITPRNKSPTSSSVSWTIL